MMNNSFKSPIRICALLSMPNAFIIFFGIEVANLCACVSCGILDGLNWITCFLLSAYSNSNILVNMFWHLLNAKPALDSLANNMAYCLGGLKQFNSSSSSQSVTDNASYAWALTAPDE